jgi:hypothetical protein
MPLLHRRTDHDTDVHDRDRDGIDDRAEAPRGDRYDDRYDDRSRAAAAGRVAAGTAAPVAVDERTSFSTHEGWNTAVRVLAMVAAAVATIIGVIALFRIDWTNGLDSRAVDVAGMIMTPKVAIVTVIAGIIALAAAASPERSSKLVVGAVLAIAGVAILLIGDADRLDLQVERRHGWLALVVGAVLILAGLLMRNTWTARRRVATDRR